MSKISRMILFTTCGVCGKKVTEKERLSIKLTEENEVWQCYHPKCFTKHSSINVVRNN